jgi:phosphoribosylaminoimidazole-succinocarboxamide synthase
VFTRPEEWKIFPEMRRIARHAFLVLEKAWALEGGRLVDFKVEFGRLYEGEMVRTVLADEISPDSCRLWDISTNDKLDKDRFRRDLGGLIEAYQEVARRLGILAEADVPKRSRPKLVKSD